METGKKWQKKEKADEKKADGKKNIFKVIGNGFELWWKNPIIILPFLFYIFISIVIGAIVFLFVGLAIFGSFKGSDFGVNGLIAEESLNETVLENILGSLNLSTTAWVLLIICGIILILLLLFARAFFSSGAIAMAREVVQGKKTSLKTMNSAGKKFFWRYFLVGLIISILAILWLFIFSLPAIISKEITLVFIPLVSLIPLFFLYIFFYLAEYLLVVNDLNVINALKESFNLVKRNYWAALGLWILFFLMSIVVSFIPFISFLSLFIQLLILTPVTTIAFTLFVLGRQ